jgi:hypothetical protein
MVSPEFRGFSDGVNVRPCGALLVIAGLDPAIHPLRKALAKSDGYADPGYAKASYAKASPGTSVSGRRSLGEDGKPAYDA